MGEITPSFTTQQGDGPFERKIIVDILFNKGGNIMFQVLDVPNKRFSCQQGNIFG